jgi:hypothetical protein
MVVNVAKEQRLVNATDWLVANVAKEQRSANATDWLADVT